MLGKLKDAAMRCILKPVDVSKCVCGWSSTLGSAVSSPDLAGFEFGGGKWGSGIGKG